MSDSAPQERIPRELDPEINAKRMSIEGSKVDTDADLFHCMVVYLAGQSWRDLKLIKNQFDLRRYYDLIRAERFEAVVETGCQSGASSLFFMDVLSMSGLKDSPYIGIDIPGAWPEQVHNYPHPHALIRRDCLAYETLDDVKRLLDGRSKILISLDSVHSKVHVDEELKMYAPLCGPGSYLVVEDTDHGGRPVWPHYGPCGYESVEEFLTTDLGRSFHRDVDIEARYGMTNSPGAWLRKAGCVTK